MAGGRETADGRQARDQAEMVRALQQVGVAPGRAGVTRVAPDGTHSEASWWQDSPAAYRWLVRWPR